MWRRLSSLSPLISASTSSSLNQATYKFKIWESFTSNIPAQAKGGMFSKGKTPFITFVLGGPGSGKGTQCTKIVNNYGFKHISAGELLRREIASNSEYGTMILSTIKDGKIVPSEVTVKLIQKEMESSDSHRFLIDGFPRTEENRIAFEKIIGVEPDLVLFFDCPQEEMVKRVLNRNEGRVDDNIDTIKKRLMVFEALNLPVINYYSQRGKLYTINAVGTVDEIFEQVRPVFAAVFLIQVTFGGHAMFVWERPCLGGKKALQNILSTWIEPDLIDRLPVQLLDVVHWQHCSTHLCLSDVHRCYFLFLAVCHSKFAALSTFTVIA